MQGEIFVHHKISSRMRICKVGVGRWPSSRPWVSVVLCSGAVPASSSVPNQTTLLQTILKPLHLSFSLLNQQPWIYWPYPHNAIKNGNTISANIKTQSSNQSSKVHFRQLPRVSCTCFIYIKWLFTFGELPSESH